MLSAENTALIMKGRIALANTLQFGKGTYHLKAVSRQQTCSLIKRREDDAINGLTPKSIATLRQR